MTIKPAIALLALALAANTYAAGPVSPTAAVKAAKPKPVWVLDAASSTLVASALKNESVTVNVSFPALSGTLDPKTAKGSVKADLNGLQTGNPIRDKNVKDLFFEAATHGEAVFTWKGKPADLKALKLGVSRPVTLTGELSLHGFKSALGGPAILSHLADDSYKARFSGWTLGIADLKMGETLAAMNKLCPQPHRVANDVTLKGEFVFKKQ